MRSYPILWDRRMWFQITLNTVHLVSKWYLLLEQIMDKWSWELNGTTYRNSSLDQCECCLIYVLSILFWNSYVMCSLSLRDIWYSILNWYFKCYLQFTVPYVITMIISLNFDIRVFLWCFNWYINMNFLHKYLSNCSHS